MTSLKDITAMEPLEVMIPQGTDAWLDYRQNGRDGKPYITGTGMPAIVPHPDIEGKYCQTLFETNCPQALADLLNGKTQINVPAHILGHGNDYEDEARHALEQITNKKYTPRVYSKWHWLASLDGETDDGETLCEIKCPWSQKGGHLWKDVSKGIVPEAYRCQMALQFLVAPNAKQIDFYVYASETQEGLLIELYKEHFEDLFAPMVQATEEFVYKYDTGYYDHPEIENEHTLQFIKEYKELSAKQAEVKELKQQFDSKREVMWKRHGNFSCDGFTFTGKEVAASVGWKSIVDSIIEKHPELELEIEDIVSAHRDSKELGFGYKFKEI